MSKEASNGQLSRALYWAIVHGQSIENIPSLVKQIIENKSWQAFLIEDTGEIKTHDTFVNYVTDTPPEGLGTNIETLWRLCNNDVEAQTAIDEATKRGNGNPTGNNQYQNGNYNNIQVSTPKAPIGTTRQAGLRRLRSQRPDLHTRVLAHEISVHAAMIEAGFRPKTVTIPIDPKRAAKTIRQHFTNDQIQILIDSLVDY